MRHSVEEYMLTRMDHDGYVEAPVTSIDEYPDYIRQEVAETVAQVRILQEEHTVSFGFITDTHYPVRLHATNRIRLRRTLNAYRELSERLGLAFLAMGGDHTNDGDKQYKSDCFIGLREELKGIRYFPVNGNHDNNAIWDLGFVPSDISTQHLTKAESYELFYNHIPEQGGVFGQAEQGLYYYVDNADLKIRAIFLDTGDMPYTFAGGKLRYDLQHDYAFSQKQLDWLIQYALELPEPGWTIVLFAHVSPVLQPGNSEDKSRLEILHTILKNYKAGTACNLGKGAGDFRQEVAADFSSYTRGEIACMLLGHSHVDSAVEYDGIWYIETGCSVMYTGAADSIPRKDGDKSELLFDVVTVDPGKKTVYLTRVGAADDRVFTY